MLTSTQDIRRGGTLVTAQVQDELVPEAERIGQDGSVDVSERRREYEAADGANSTQMRLHTGRMKSKAKACATLRGLRPFAGSSSVTKGASHREGEVAR